MPDSAFIREVCRRHGGAVALTSANVSGSESPICINDFRGLWQECAGVFDAGEVGTERSGSTIVDLAVAGRFRVLRPGCAHEEVRHVLQCYGLAEQL